MSTLKVHCAAARDLLDGLVDDELSGEDRAWTNLHLSGCAGCRRELEQLRGLLGAARALPRLRAPERDLWPVIATRAARATRDQMATRLPPRLGVFAAAAALVLVVGAFGARAALGPPGSAHGDWPPGLSAAGGSYPSGAGGGLPGETPRLQGGTAGGPQGGAGGATSAAR